MNDIEVQPNGTVSGDHAFELSALPVESAMTTELDSVLSEFFVMTTELVSVLCVLASSVLPAPPQVLQV